MLSTAIVAANPVQHSSDFDLGDLLEWRLAPWSPILNRVGRKLCCGGRQSKMHGSVGLVQRLSHHQQLVRMRPAQLLAFLMLLSREMFNIKTSIINLVSLVAVDLCWVLKKVKRGEFQWVLSHQRSTFLLQVRPLVVLQWKLLSKEVLRSREREKAAVTETMPQFFRGNTNNNSVVYMYRLLAFVVSGSMKSITVIVCCTERMNKKACHCRGIVLRKLEIACMFSVLYPELEIGNFLNCKCQNSMIKSVKLNGCLRKTARSLKKM